MTAQRAVLHDGNSIALEISGHGPTVLLPVNPVPVEGPDADELRAWGGDPALGRSLIDGLADAFRVVAFDYEGHVLSVPKPDTLTAANVVRDLLAVGDAAGAERFAYYGYSWLAMVGLHLAIGTPRLSALVMGGFPPLDGPYSKMLTITAATSAMAADIASGGSGSGPGGPRDRSTADTADFDSTDLDWESVDLTLTEAQTRQFVTLYESLRSFDDRAAQGAIRCPRLCFAGSADQIEYGERWGGVRVDLAGPLISLRGELESLGWQVHVLEGLDHMQAMRAVHVLPILRPWLLAHLPPPGS